MIGMRVMFVFLTDDISISRLGEQHQLATTQPLQSHHLFNLQIRLAVDPVGLMFPTAPTTSKESQPITIAVVATTATKHPTMATPMALVEELVLNQDHILATTTSRVVVEALHTLI
jgi:hypothetical protein